MPTLMTYPKADLTRLRDWFSVTSLELFDAKSSVEDQESKVRLHVAAQEAHHIAAELERFASAHQALLDDGLIVAESE